jgi:hypothetical protein
VHPTGFGSTGFGRETLSNTRVWQRVTI